MDNKLKLERFMLRVPDEAVEEFLGDMDEQVRTAQELAAFIIVMHYRRKKTERLQKMAEQSTGEPESIPHYGPKLAKASDKDLGRSGGEV